MKCKLIPTRNSLAYAGSVTGREIVYERSVQQVRADIARKGHGRFRQRTTSKPLHFYAYSIISMVKNGPINP